MKVAFYLRVSTSDQTTDNQLRELQAVATARGWTVVHIYQDEAISGSKKRDQRPGLKAMMIAATRHEFDLIATWSIDRLGRSLSDLIHTSEDLRNSGIELYVHKQAVDTTTSTGRLTYSILGAIAEWEREMIRERVLTGMARAKANGTRFGRPVSIPEHVREEALRLYREGLPLATIAKQTEISKSTVRRLLKKQIGWLE